MSSPRIRVRNQVVTKVRDELVGTGEWLTMEERIPKDKSPKTWRSSFMAQRARDRAWEYFAELHPSDASLFEDADDLADRVRDELLRRAKTYGIRHGYK